MRYTNITANGTVAIKAGQGILHRIVVNKKGASSNIATITDGAAGVGILDTTDRVGSIEYGLPFSDGLTIVLGTGTAANLTVVWE